MIIKMIKKLMLMTLCIVFNAQTNDDRLSYISCSNLASCIQFNFENSHQEYWNELAKKYSLYQFVDDNDDLQTAMNIMHWVSGLWRHNGYNLPKQSDPLFILDQVMKHGQQFRCVEYAKVTRGCLIAVGIPCRLLCLKTQDCATREYGAGHVVCELFLKSKNKWVMLDPQFDVVAFVVDEPVNAVELMYALHEKTQHVELRSLDQENAVLESGLSWKQLEQEYWNFIQQYLFYFDTPLFFYDPYVQSTGNGVMLVPAEYQAPSVFQNERSLNYLTATGCIDCFYKAEPSVFIKTR